MCNRRRASHSPSFPYSLSLLTPTVSTLSLLPPSRPLRSSASVSSPSYLSSLRDSSFSIDSCEISCESSLLSIPLTALFPAYSLFHSTTSLPLPPLLPLSQGFSPFTRQVSQMSFSPSPLRLLASLPPLLFPQILNPLYFSPYHPEKSAKSSEGMRKWRESKQIGMGEKREGDN